MSWSLWVVVGANAGVIAGWVAALWLVASIVFVALWAACVRGLARDMPLPPAWVNDRRPVIDRARCPIVASGRDCVVCKLERSKT